MPSSSTETPTTKPTTSHSRVAEHVGDVGEQRGVAGDLDAGVAASARRSATRSGVRSSVGPKVGSASKTRSAPSVEAHHGRHRGHVVARRDLRGEGRDGVARDPVGRCHEHDRPVRAGPELVGDQVVGLAGGQVARTGRRSPAARSAWPAPARPASAAPRPTPAPRPAGRRATRVAHRAIIGRAGRARDPGAPGAAAAGDRRGRTGPGTRVSAAEATARPRSRWRSRRSRTSAARRA